MMFDVCPGCGQYDEEKLIDAFDDAIAVCPHCGHRHHFVKLPVFVITGASGAGKSAVALHLPEYLPGYVTFEVDVLWRDEFATPEDDYHSFRNLCLRVAKDIGQSGRPVVLLGSATPGQYEQTAQARYFTQVHYLALVCQPDELERRLQARPAWRGSAAPDFIRTMRDFNQWFLDSSVPLIDNTHLSVEAGVQQVANWIQEKEEN